VVSAGCDSDAGVADDVGAHGERVTVAGVVAVRPRLGSFSAITVILVWCATSPLGGQGPKVSGQSGVVGARGRAGGKVSAQGWCRQRRPAGTRSYAGDMVRTRRTTGPSGLADLGYAADDHLGQNPSAGATAGTERRTGGYLGLPAQRRRRAPLPDHRVRAERA